MQNVICNQDLNVGSTIKFYGMSVDSKRKFLVKLCGRIDANVAEASATIKLQCMHGHPEQLFRD
jgi:hypothetical protein